ncbi:hypothetical protein BJ508DRAFT_324730 [Ascobolus immersus RN42]|uniref:Uncharacterized protein n=1 Tax=Ascobolus immersus RN42 TaxID=1160509 RepID=A0A3N4ICG8_ASCIM|nr:hypothetical protein BJ508DRAFT_324730 [Ascobolus immersus RN42]
MDSSSTETSPLIPSAGLASAISSTLAKVDGRNGQTSTTPKSIFTTPTRATPTLMFNTPTTPKSIYGTPPGSPTSPNLVSPTPSRPTPAISSPHLTNAASNRPPPPPNTPISPTSPTQPLNLTLHTLSLSTPHEEDWWTLSAPSNTPRPSAHVSITSIAYRTASLDLPTTDKIAHELFKAGSEARYCLSLFIHAEEKRTGCRLEVLYLKAVPAVVGGKEMGWAKGLFVVLGKRKAGVPMYQ